MILNHSYAPYSILSDRSVKSESNLPLKDLDGNEYTTVTIGEQQWIVENFKCIKYTDGSPIPLIGSSTVYNDWFMPSVDELLLMRSELYLYGVGNFVGSISERLFESSSEYADSDFLAVSFDDGLYYNFNKSSSFVTRPCRSFNGDSGEYNVRQQGPAGGWIFAYTGGKYYEAYNEDISTTIWSNITLSIGTTDIIFGSGQTNTLAIINQSGHTDSAAKLCNDLSSGGWSNISTGAYCYYNDDILNKPIYGLLYNFYTLNNLAYLERGGIEESGWRIPTESDFNTLISNLMGSSVAGGKLKEIGTNHWNSPNTGATNESGLKILPGGYRRHDNGNYGGINTYTIINSSNNNALTLSYDSTSSSIVGVNNNTGTSIRLVRDKIVNEILTDDYGSKLTDDQFNLINL